MKNRGLSNRFNQNELQSAWAFHYRCMWCEKENADCFHHIKSPSSSDYKKGKFNTSILNSFPINNFGCHLFGSMLHKPENEKKMLNKTLDALRRNGYRLIEKDKAFMKVYADNYK